jgi:transposase
MKNEALQLRPEKSVHVATMTKKQNGRVYQSVLLRHTYRENGKVKHQTVANLSHLPDAAIEAIKATLKGQTLAAIEEDSLKQSDGKHHGHVNAVLIAIERLGLANMISPQSCQELNCVLAMIVCRILRPYTKLATQSWCGITTLPDLLDLESVDEDKLYKAMDWLLPRQAQIEGQLAARHLSEGGSAFYDLSSSYVEGGCCPLAMLGYSRDKKRGKRQITYGLLANNQGCPIKIEVFSGNTADSSTFLPMVEIVRRDFKLSRIVIVGDRGMISTKNVELLRVIEGVDWITALRAVSLKSLVERADVNLSQFEGKNLFEICAPDDYPGERLIFCHNPSLENRRAAKRNSMLEATEKLLKGIKERVEKGRLSGEGKINLVAGKVINTYKMSKHFILETTEHSFNYYRKDENIKAEAKFDGIYVIRTSLPNSKISSEDTVRQYKKLSQVERAFRSLKSIDLNLRPIHHYTEKRVRAHIFICMLAYYVTWHMRQALKELTYTDEDQEIKEYRDPVAPAERSDSADQKAFTHYNQNGEEVYSFRVLLDKLSSQVKTNTKIRTLDSKDISFNLISTPTTLQKRVFDLLKNINM